jgi:hypothetical protein
MDVCYKISTASFYPLFSIQELREDITHGHRIVERTRGDTISKCVVLFVEARE